MFRRFLTASALVLLVAAHTQAVEVGSAPPAFSLPVLKNAPDKSTSLSLDDYKGKVVYLDFWASWCGPCRKSLPILNQIRADYHEKGFEVIAVNIDEKRNDAIDFLTKYPVDYPILLDPKGKTPEKYAINGMPTAYLIDKKGKVIHVHEGFKDSDADDIREMLDKYLGKK